MSLNISNNKYCCSRCGAGGYSIGLYAKIRNIDNKKAYKELLEREYFSIDKSKIKINTTNKIANINKRDKVYREFLNMLILDKKHKEILLNKGFEIEKIEKEMYRSVPQKYIQRRIITYSLKRKYELEGIPGFYQEEDLFWIFSNIEGFFVPVFNENNKIKNLSIHLDKPYNNSTDIWFSSNGKLNGTSAKNEIEIYNRNKTTNTAILTDDLLLGNFIKDSINVPVITFSSISNSYQIFNMLKGSNITNIVFVIRLKEKQNLDYIINRVLKGLIKQNYNLKIKVISDYKDVLNDNFLDFFRIKKVV